GEAAPRDADELIGKLRQTRHSTKPTGPRPTILVVGGELPSIVDQAEDALLNDGGEELFEYGNLVVKIVRIGDPIVAAGVMRPFGAIAIRVVDVTYMVERLTLAASFEKPGKEENFPIDCPEKVAKT